MTALRIAATATDGILFLDGTLDVTYPAPYSIDSEVVEIVGGSGTSNISVRRGIGGSAAAAHLSGAALTAANAFAGGGAGLPDFMVADETPDAEQLAINARVTIFPTDQTDAAGEGLLVFRTTDDLVNQSAIGAIVGGTIKDSDGTDLEADHIFMLSVLGLHLNAPVEEGGQMNVFLAARGSNDATRLTNHGLVTNYLNSGEATSHSILTTGVSFFGHNTSAQQTLARPSGDAGALWDVLEAYGLVKAP